MISSGILIFLSVFLVTKYFWDNRRFFYLAHKIPSGTFDFSIQGIRDVLTANNKVIFQMVTDAFKNNKVCTKTWFGTSLFVGIVKPEDVKTVLNSKDCLNKPKFMKFLNVTKGSLFGGLKYWHSHRRILNPYFGVQKLRNVIPIFNEKTKIMMKNIAKMEGKDEFNVLYTMTALTLETIVKVMEYDVDIQNQKSEVRDIFIESLERYIKIVTIRTFKIWLYPDFIFKRTLLYQKQTEAESRSAIQFTDRIILNAKEKLNQEVTGSDEKPKTFVRALVDPKNDLLYSEIRDEVSTVVIAAQDTSAIASSSTILLLAMFKDIQQKVVHELHKIFGKTLEAPFINIEQLNQLEYLEMVINESMRLLPVVPFVFRQSVAEVEISEGYILPANTIIIVPINIIHHSKENWGEDADLFRPERFSKENFEKIHPYSFLPFAKGPRMCVGWRYAMFLMKIQLANFLLRYEVDTSLKFEELDFNLNITMNICQGYKISIKERNVD